MLTQSYIMAESLGWSNVLSASAFILINIIISSLFGLQLEKSLTIAAIRCLVQLTAMGSILSFVFSQDSFWIVLLMSLALVILATIEIVYNKLTLKHRYMLFTVFGSIVASTFVVAVAGNAFAIRVNPWYRSKDFIPILGMVVGNSMAAVAVGLKAALSQFQQKQHQIESYLAYGATKWEASKDVLVESIKLALLPSINAMSVIGLISIPGMMTGQILGGSPVEDAVRYQEIIMFMITSSATFSVVAAVSAAAYSVFDGMHRLRLDTISKK